jgi:nucleoside 2-deoxyribosyltransferase
MYKIRIYELAKSLGVESKEVIKAAHGMGLNASGASNSVTRDDAKGICREFPLPLGTTVSRKAAMRRIEQQIREGSKIRDLNMVTARSFANALSRASVWARNNVDMFNRLIGNDSIPDIYDFIRPPFNIGVTQNIPKEELVYETADFREFINKDIKSLESILERLNKFIKHEDAEPSSQIEKDLQIFKKEHNPSKTILIMMKFSGENPEKNAKLENLFNAIKHEVDKYGLNVVRADQKKYASSNFLWDNVQVYLNGCNYGIAVMENLYSGKINPNVALEYGYMLAKGKKVLLLKEKAFKNIQADMLGQLWEEFELDKMGSIQRAIKQWMIDLGMIQIKA